ncbi:hypothetical protein VXT26_16075 [Pseudomonas aeruginosa]|uniref:hypothetical protein n=1 Tax=Pseudomonas aeruginosa TaxID=287 RepID=UPI002E19008C|nr:hypothetical protein [Pseudomonas aeruginosa]
MSEVKRFDHVNHAHIDDCEHVESSEGAWVTASDYDALAAEAQALREEVAALRARVVVLPDASTVYAALDARERLFTSPENIQVALEAQSRLNGKTVSEGLLRKWLELMEHGDYREGHCMCGSPVDSHGIGDGHAPIDAGEYYAGQVMEELRALLNQDKENGNG